MQGKRVERIGELIRNELGNVILSRIRDPRIGFVTVTRVEVSADLHYAKVFCSVLGDTVKRKETHRTLNHARGFLQKDLAQVLNLRYTPHLDFYLDETLDHSIEISGILKKIHTEDGSIRNEQDKQS